MPQIHVKVERRRKPLAMDSERLTQTLPEDVPIGSFVAQVRARNGANPQFSIRREKLPDKVWSRVDIDSEGTIRTNGSLRGCASPL